jgi:hypothetical protein
MRSLVSLTTYLPLSLDLWDSAGYLFSESLNLDFRFAAAFGKFLWVFFFVGFCSRF